MAASAAKSLAQAPTVKAGPETARETDRMPAGPALVPKLAADPQEGLNRGAGNRAVSSLLAPAAIVGTGQGLPLPRRLRAEMEDRFQEDFKTVRIHQDKAAATAAATLQAKAFAIGHDIVFAERRYAPETFDGKRLLVHELAHVVQQRRGGGAPGQQRSSATETAAEQTARALMSGARRVRVEGASRVGIARVGEDEFETALAGWTKLDQQTEEEARRKPGPSPARAANTVPNPDPAPEAQKLNPVLRAKSRLLRRRRAALLQARDAAVSRGEDPAAIKADPLKRPIDIKKYQAATRAAMQQHGDAEAARHEAAVRGQPAMSHEDMFNKVVAMRGFAAGGSVWDQGRLKTDYDAVRTQIESHPDRAEIDALQAQNIRLRREIAKIKIVENKQGKLSTEDKARRRTLTKTVAANTTAIEASPVTALRQKANGLHNRLAISGLRDPKADKAATSRDAPSKGAPAGRGDNTYAIVQVLDKNGKIIAWGAGTNNAHGHAEENALIQIRKQVAGLKNGLPPGTRVEVVGDQVVCSAICKKSLAAFAAANHVDRVDGYTFHAILPGKKADANGGRELTAKATAVEATTANAGTWALSRKHEPIYSRDGGLLGGGAPTKGEVHRHEAKKKQKQPPKGSAAKATPKRKPGRAAGGARPQAKPADTAVKVKKPARAAPPTAKPAAKPAAKGKAPSSAADVARPASDRRAAPTASTPDAQAPVRRAPPARKAPPVDKPPAAPRPQPPRKGAPAPPPAPVAKSPPPAASITATPRTPVVPPPPPAHILNPAPVARPTPHPAPPRSEQGPQGAEARKTPLRSTAFSRHGGAFLAPGTAGAAGGLGAQATQQHANGISTGQSVAFDGSVAIDVTEVPDKQPRMYRVTLRVDLSGQVDASATGESAGGGASAGVALSASAKLSGSFSHELTAEAARKYQAAARDGGGGGYSELEVVRLLAAHKTDAARAALEQLNAASGSAAAARRLAPGDAAEVAAEGTIGGQLQGSAGNAGIELGLFRSGRVERRVEERNGKIVVTMTIASEAGRTVGGTASEGVASFGLSDTAATNRLRSVSFTLDPNDQAFDPNFNAITSANSIDELDRLRTQHPELAGAITTGQGTSGGNSVRAGILGVGVEINQAGSFNEEETRDASGLSHRYEGSGTLGGKFTAGHRTLASSSTTDTFVGEVGPDNLGGGETRSRRSETNLGRSLDRLETSFAKAPVSTVVGIGTGKTKLVQERVDTKGTALTDDSYGRLANLAQDPVAWEHAWQADIDGLLDWRKARGRVLAAHGDRNQIARAMAQFESKGSGRSGTVEKAIGGTGIAFEFPDELADQKPVYDSLVVGDPVGQARDLAERGQPEAAINTLNAANDRLGKLSAAIQAHDGAFESPTKLAQMLNLIGDRRSQLRGELRQMTRAAHPTAAAPAPGVATGDPETAKAAAGPSEDDAKAKREELQARTQELTRSCDTLRRNERAAFAHIREELGTWHVFHLSASVDLAAALTKVKNSWSDWDATVTKLKGVYKDAGEDPAKADALGPDRPQWDELQAQWKTF